VLWKPTYRCHWGVQRKQTTKHTAETKLPWFSRLLRHSARKRGGLILQRPRAPHWPGGSTLQGSINDRTDLLPVVEIKISDLLVKRAVVQNVDAFLDDDGYFAVGLFQVRLQTTTKHWTWRMILCHTYAHARPKSITPVSPTQVRNKLATSLLCH